MKGNIKHVYTFILTLCLLLGFGTKSHALPQDSIPNEKTPVTVRTFDAEALEAFRTDEDFQYYEAVRTDANFWERLKYRIQKWLQEAYYDGQASGLWEVLIYVAIAVAIVFIIIKMQNVDVGGLLGRKAESQALPYEVLEENIHEMDMETLIANAVEQRDYRKAVRLHYLQSLKHLTDLGLIEWKAGKTNRSYIQEITASPLRQEFEQLTSMFEYVWYGGAALSHELFDSAKKEFIQFNTLVKQRA